MSKAESELVRKVNRLRANVDQLKATKSRLEGQLEVFQKDLEELGVSNLEGARELLEKLKAREKQLIAGLNEILEAIDAKYFPTA